MLYDYIIIGGGAAGMTAAWEAWRQNPDQKILLIDREEALGGVLRQCLHQGFGLSYFREDLTGREYADRLIKRLKNTSVEILLQTEVLKLLPCAEVILSNSSGIASYRFRHLILAAGCTERPLGNLGVSGTRPAGVYTAGEAQRLINLHHKDIGDQAIIIGSGDIAMIMARRLTLHNKKVLCITDIACKSPSLPRNQEDCLHRYHIPLYLRTKLKEIHGYPQIEAVTLLDMDSSKEQTIACSLLIIAAGLIPDRSLLEDLPGYGASSFQIPRWLHLCGNCHHVHPIVDGVSRQAEQVIRNLPR